MLRGSRELDSVALEQAAPYLVMEVFPGTTLAEKEDPLVGWHVAGPHSAKTFRYSFGQSDFTESQQ